MAKKNWHASFMRSCFFNVIGGMNDVVHENDLTCPIGMRVSASKPDDPCY